MKLLIGGSSSKIFHLKEFAKKLEEYHIETKVVFDGQITLMCRKQGLFSSNNFPEFKKENEPGRRTESI